MLEIDAFSVAISSVLDQYGAPLAFFSHKICPCIRSAIVYSREVDAVTKFVKKNGDYFLRHPFHAQI